MRVYWHSRRRLFSVVAGTGGGRVVAHLGGFALKDARFVVRPAGRRRVLETGVKTPHAYVAGALMPSSPRAMFEGEAVAYDPRRHASFVATGTGRAVAAARRVEFLACWRPLVSAAGVVYASEGDGDGA